MKKALIASYNETENLLKLIKEHSFTNIVHTPSGSDARRITINKEFDLIIINTPLKDEFGHELAMYAAEKTDSAIILICKSDISEELSEKLNSYEIFVINKPIDKTAFSQAMQSINSPVPEYNNKNSKFEKKTQELKLINKAKSCLMHYLEFSESQAHKYIEKQAMDTRQTRKEVAKNILSTYDF